MRAEAGAAAAAAAAAAGAGAAGAAAAGAAGAQQAQQAQQQQAQQEAQEEAGVFKCKRLSTNVAADWCDTTCLKNPTGHNCVASCNCPGSPKQELQLQDAPWRSRPRLTNWASSRQLNRLFDKGIPSNDPRLAGLLVHCFDQTEDCAPWKPCTKKSLKEQRCAGAPWWSTSIINAKQHRTFGNSGIILAPHRAKILCSNAMDFGTSHRGCNATYEGRPPHPPNQLKDMLVTSMSETRASDYNEVLVDVDNFIEHLPESIAGFVYGLQGADTFGIVQAVRSYVSFLDYFKLNESQVPLLRATYDYIDADPQPGAQQPSAQQLWLRQKAGEEPTFECESKVEQVGSDWCDLDLDDPTTQTCMDSCRCPAVPRFASCRGANGYYMPEQAGR